MEEVPGAAPLVQGRPGSGPEDQLRGQVEQVVGAVRQSLGRAEDILQLAGARGLFLLDQAGHVQGAGQAGRGREPLRMGQGQLEGAVAAHGQAGREILLPARREREQVAGQAGQFLADKAPVALAPERIGVEAAPCRGQDHGQPPPLQVPLQAGAPQPHGVVVGQAVQQVQGRVAHRFVGRVAVLAGLRQERAQGGHPAEGL